MTSETDSAIAPPQKNKKKKQRSVFTNASWLLDARKDAVKVISSYVFLLAKDDRTMTLGWQGAPYFRKYGRELVSKPAISVKKSWGGVA